MKPLFDWTTPPVGRRFTFGMTWGDFFTFLHRESGHAIAFGAMPVAWFYAPRSVFWMLVAVAIALAVLRVVIVGGKPTRVGFAAFFDLLNK